MKQMTTVDDTMKSKKKTKSKRIWSPLQIDIFDAGCETDNNLVIQACAGSGKTTTLIQLIIYLARSGHTNMKLMAFSRAINEEAKKRLDNAGVRESTCKVESFNSYGFTLCRRKWKKVKFSAQKQDNYVKSILQDELLEINRALLLSADTARQNKKAVAAFDAFGVKKAVGKLVSAVRGKGVFLAEYVQEKYCEFVQAVQDDILGDELDSGDLDQICTELLADLTIKVVRACDEDLAEIDFADQVRLPVLYNLVTKRNSPKIVLSDESQDLARYNLLTLEQMTKHGTRLIAVGDRQQAIFAFRGADETSMDKLLHMSNAKELPLSITYRCPSLITGYINNRIAMSSLVPFKTGGTLIHVDIDKAFYEATTTDKYLAAVIAAGDTKRIDKARLAFTVEHRCSVIIKNNIDMVVSATNVALLKIHLELHKRGTSSCLNKTNLISTLIAVCYTYKKKLSRWLEFLDQLAEVLDKPPARMSATRLDNLKSIDVVIKQLNVISWEGLIKALISIQDQSQVGPELHTVHSAKGLEAANVYVVDTFFNSSQRTNMEYVAMTRAASLLAVEFAPIKVRAVKPGHPRLTIELVPESQHRDNLRSMLSDTEWGYCKAYVRRMSQSRCEVCGGVGEQWPVECHEQWQYTYRGVRKLLLSNNVKPEKSLTKRLAQYMELPKEKQTVKAMQTLVGLIALCPTCHLATHYGHAQVVGKEGQARSQLMGVNNWNRVELDRYLQKVFKRHVHNSHFTWELDVSWLLTQPEIRLDPETISKIKIK